jgi:hypothetical protein
MSSVRSSEGQASVELVALLPLVGVIALLLWEAVLAGQAVWLTGSATRAAARADAVGRDPAVAARSVLPPALRPSARIVRRSDGVVSVRIGPTTARSTLGRQR